MSLNRIPKILIRINSKLYSSQCNKKVKVRFAPSPTGSLHIGGLRTALYNHLFAKSQNGVTLLRIEDTDQSRKVPNAAENLIEDLAWCGINYDEGPIYQSERKEIYQNKVQQLIDQGDAYHCFCSSSRLELMKKEAKKTGEVLGYDNHCRHLSKEEVNERLKNGESSCVRFKLTNYSEPFHDIVFGFVSHNVATTEGDPVILKSDGMPTYHLACVVDDHLMDITHVLRGIEWQISTVKHLLLYRAFKWEPPQFGHLPVLLNSQGTKLSKREGGTQIGSLRDAGYLPKTVLNFVISYGGGFETKLSDKLYSMDELTTLFDITKLKNSSSRVNFLRLKTLNQIELQEMLQTDEGKAILGEKIQSLVLKFFENSPQKDKVEFDFERNERILRSNIRRFNYLAEFVANFSWYWVRCNDWVVKTPAQKIVIERLIDCLKSQSWEVVLDKKFFKNFYYIHCEEMMEYSDLMRLLRYVLSGLREDGMPVKEIIDLLGKEEVILRLSNAVNVQLKNDRETEKETKKIN